MNTKKLFASLAIAFAMTLTFALWAQEPAPPATPADPVAPVVAEEPPLGELTAPAAGATVPEVSPPVEAVVTPESPSGSAGKERARRNRPRSSGDAMVVFNRDAELPAGSTRDAVVSIGGSSTAYGDVAGAVVSIMGDSRADGTVGDVVVSILGNTTVNGRVDTAIAVFGGVRLGPNAEVKDVISVGGPIERAPGAKVTGQAQEVGFLDHMPNFTGFRAWIRHALFWGRPLAVADNLGWAWGVAAVFFGLYLALALLFPKAVESGLETIETRPGRTVLAALVCMVLTPIITVLLAVTVVGPLLAVVAVTVATFFGKAALLAWMGRRAMLGAWAGTRAQTVLAVAVGGILLTALYLVPLVGLALWKLTGMLGLGVTVYTLVLNARRARPGRPPVAAAAGWGASPGLRSAPSASFTVPPTSQGFTASGTGEAVPMVPGEGLGVTEEPSSTFAGSNISSLSLPLSALPRAGFWIRLGALAIDVVVVGAASSVLSVGSVFLLLLATYGAIMWKMKGTTIGGIVCGLKVVRLDERPVDWTTAIVRALASFLSLFVAGLGFLWIAFDPERQSWHDKIAGTAVIQLPQGTSLV